MGMRVAMSCLSTYAPARGDVPRCVRPRRSSSVSVPRRHDVKAEAPEQESPRVEIVLDPVAIVARVKGREGWLREARSQLEEHRRLAADTDPRGRAERLLEAERRLLENLSVEREANEAYEHHRATARDQGRPAVRRAPESLRARRRCRRGRST